ncbi:MucR family transcriptional regulator [Methylobacterium symbioticum]|uniref:Transcriptional regulatory protein ros n=1 Tax=Methylobacterium symbioticum TaxID=2584084 RepID=A0A509E9I0_9HYPH|nr:MucR family transcriptional regulator [Methylobacterium symbioticum]VUD69793.1 Transcriptional regulatory protein ros [Methylobacterium symbioticum]
MQPEPDVFELAAKIVIAYVAHNSVPSGQLPDLVSTVHQSLRTLGAPAKEELKKATDAQIRASIRPDSIISFEDGKPYKALRRHLTLRGLTPEAYRAKWGLPIDYPLVCATYSAERSRISRAIGLGQKLRSAAT